MLLGLVACKDEPAIDPIEDAKVPTQKIEQTFKKLEELNYTYSYQGENWFIDSNNILHTTTENTKGKYYSKQNGKTVEYTLSTEKEGYWEKDFAEQELDVDAIIYDDLSESEWTSYDEKKDEITGTFKGEKSVLKIESDGDFSIKNDKGEAVVSDVSRTNVDLPTDVIDNTVEGPIIEEIPFDKINDFIANLAQNNYTADTITDDVVTVYKLANGIVSISAADVKEKFYYSENEKNIIMSYNAEDGEYHKNFTDEKINMDNNLDSAIWTEQKNGITIGTLNGKPIELELKDNGTVHIVIEDWSGTFSAIGSTVVELPKEFVDDTINRNELYEIVDGKIVYNYNALKDTFTDWILWDNTKGKDLISFKSATNDLTLNRIIYVNLKSDKVELGIISNRKNSNCEYTIYTIKAPSILNSLKNGELKTKKAFIDVLNESGLRYMSNTGLNEDIHYSTLDYNHDILDDLTESVFKKLKEVGTQTTIDNADPSSKIDFTQNKIAIAFKTTTKHLGAGMDLGYIEAWEQYYIMQIDGKYKLLCINLAVTSAGAGKEDITIQNVINNKRRWYVTRYNITELDAGNTNIYDENANKAANTADKQRAYACIHDCVAVGKEDKE